MLGMMQVPAGDSVTRFDIQRSEYLAGDSPNFTIAAGQTMELADIVLQLGGMVQGLVVDANGTGLPSIQISVLKQGETTPDVGLTATSDASGQFLLRGLPAGAVSLVAQSPKYIEELVEGEQVQEASITQDVRIVLQQGAHVNGVVLDSNGIPVVGAKVIAKDISVSAGMKELRTPV